MDDAEEEDVTDSELSSSEDEDVDLCDTKPKVKSAFVDDEVGMFNFILYSLPYKC